MNAGKPTPGPWSVGGDEEGAYEVWAHVHGTQCVATCEPLLDEESANAHLIAAAPDLLAELSDSTALLTALLGAMPPALQKKWPSITKRAAARITSSLAAIAKAGGVA